MQEENKKEGRTLTYVLVAIIGFMALAAVCLFVVAAVLLFAPSNPVPTLAAQAQLEELLVQPNGEMEQPATVEPSPQTADAVITIAPDNDQPLVPQSGGRSAGDPYTPELGNTGYDVIHYTLELALDPATEHVDGKATIDVVSTLHGLSQLSLDFIGYEIGAINVDGIPANFGREDGKLIVDLSEPMAEGTPFTLSIDYRGQPDYRPSPYLLFVDHLGLHFPDGNTIFAIAEPDGARYWYPANDHPRDKATFRFEIVVPAGMTAVANGRLLSQEPGLMPDGTPGELFIWGHDRPMATYLALVAVGQYERIESQSPAGIPIRHYSFPDLRSEMESIVPESAAAIDWMSDLFGPYPFEAFGYVTAYIPGGSLETQTMVLLSNGMIGKRTAVHELAHMWFGDWVSLDSWSEMWRNEGFATYVQLMWETRDDPEELDLQIAALESVVEGNDKSYPLNDPPPAYLFELNIYFQGAVVVHALRQEVGDEAFFTGLRTYFERFGGGVASDEQFQEVMEEAAGRSLEPFFQEWFPGS